MCMILLLCGMGLGWGGFFAVRDVIRGVGLGWFEGAGKDGASCRVTARASGEG